MISHHHNDLLVAHFEIEKSKELVARKNFSYIFYRNIEAYIKGCDICLTLNVICHKPYSNL